MIEVCNSRLDSLPEVADSIASNFEEHVTPLPARVFLHFAIHAHIALLHQACAHTAGTETLAKEDVL